MTIAVLSLWLVSALLLVFERRVYRLIIYFGIFSLITSFAFLQLGAPDVAMAEAGISAFATIFFIICIDKYYSGKESRAVEKKDTRKLLKLMPPLAFCVGLFLLFIHFMPGVDEALPYLKYVYLANFMTDVGGQNAVAATLLGYRMYDTLFEALILIIAVVAVAHLSFFAEDSVADGRHSEIESSGMADFTIRIICPIIVLFGVYLAVNGHISAGGGFQGGLAVATFFICRYLVYNIYDLPVERIIRLEEVIFMGIIIVSGLAIFLGIASYIPEHIRPTFQVIYLIMMNALIGLKVACGFFVLFYRYVAIERM